MIARCPDDTSEAAHRILRRFIERNAIPGLSIAIVDREGPVFSAGFGYRDLATEAPATPETTYLWFSLTKIVTATAALRLVDDGRLDLDAPVADYVPRVGDRNPTATVRQLLNHTAGFANPVPIRWVRPAHTEAPPGDELLDRLIRDMVGRVATLEVRRTIRTSDTSYSVPSSRPLPANHSRPTCATPSCGPSRSTEPTSPTPTLSRPPPDT